MKRKKPKFVPVTMSCVPVLELKPIPLTVSGEPTPELKFLPPVTLSYESTLDLKPIPVTLRAEKADKGAVKRVTKAVRTARAKKVKAKRKGT